MTTPGTTFGNRYTLNERIAVGGMGEVWQATDQVLGRLVAIKLLSASLASQPGFTRRFREEARHTAALGHANIAAVYDYGEDEGASWLVMELVNGRPLSQIIRDEGAQSPQRTAAIIAQAADALQAAHDAGVIHRDVKPANILVRPDGVVKLTDFGIARAVDSAPLTRTGEVLGTAQYISPEQAMGHPLGPPSDLYSLACVAHEMLTGRRAFDDGSAVATAMAHVHKPPPPLPGSVPAAMARIVMSSLSKDATQRPASARDVAAALQATAASAPTAATAATAATTAPPGATAIAPPPTDGGIPAGPPPRTEAMTSPTGYALRMDAGDDVGGLGTGGSAAWRAGRGSGDKRRTPAMWLIPLLAVLLLLGLWGITRALSAGTPTPQPTPTPAVVSSSVPPTTATESTTSPSTSTKSSTASTVTVTASRYVGRRVSGVVSQLTGLGLRPAVVRVSSDQPRDTVLGVSPTGQLNRGDRVEVQVSRGRPTATTSSTTRSPVPTTAPPMPTPTPTYSSRTTSDEARPGTKTSSSSSSSSASSSSSDPDEEDQLADNSDAKTTSSNAAVPTSSARVAASRTGVTGQSAPTSSAAG